MEPKGTTILINGKVVEDLSSFSFWFYNDLGGSPVSLGFTTRDPDPKAGELAKYTSYSLVPPAAKANAAAGLHRRQPPPMTRASICNPPDVHASTA